MKKFFKIKNILFATAIFLSFVYFPLEARDRHLRIGAIPDQNQELLDRRFNLLSKELSRLLNIEVKYVPVIDYISAVSAFRTKDLDLVWFGGLSGIQARLQTPNSFVLAQRDIDKRFRSVFIVNKKINLKTTYNLNDLKLLKGLRFTFGSENSTSGRLMPEYFLNNAEVQIKDFRGGRAGYSGSHDATIALVNSGSFDAGVLNKQIWERNLDANPKRTKNVKVFFTTPEYRDYHWLVQGDLDSKIFKGCTNKIKGFFLSLDKNNSSHKQILLMFNAEKFIDSDASQYKEIESIARKLKKIK